MSLISRLSVRLPEPPETRRLPGRRRPRPIIQAARQFATRKLGAPILVGDRTRIKINAARLNIKLDGIRIIEPTRTEEFPEYVRKFRSLQRFQGLSDLEAEDLVAQPNYYATLMVAMHAADAIVSGATGGPASGLRPILQILPRQEGIDTVSSMQILEMEDGKFGIEGALFLTGLRLVIPEPSAEQLADQADEHRHARAPPHEPYAARRHALAYSTKSSGTRSPAVERVKVATSIAKAKAREFDMPVEIDGELQVDAALDPFTAAVKDLDSPVAGQANVLVFPHLNCANIASKMVQLLAGIPAYGQILTGLERPAAEISRGASAHDIFGTAVLVAAQAVDKRYLYPVVPKA